MIKAAELIWSEIAWDVMEIEEAQTGRAEASNHLVAELILDANRLEAHALDYQVSSLAIKEFRTLDYSEQVRFMLEKVFTYPVYVYGA